MARESYFDKVLAVCPRTVQEYAYCLSTTEKKEIERRYKGYSDMPSHWSERVKQEWFNYLVEYVEPRWHRLPPYMKDMLRMDPRYKKSRLYANEFTKEIGTYWWRIF